MDIGELLQGFATRINDIEFRLDSTEQVTNDITSVITDMNATFRELNSQMNHESSGGER
jgi:uncharacterized coiled-coil protein SlyX